MQRNLQARAVLEVGQGVHKRMLDPEEFHEKDYMNIGGLLEFRSWAPGRETRGVSCSDPKVGETPGVQVQEWGYHVITGVGRPYMNALRCWQGQGGAE